MAVVAIYLTRPYTKSVAQECLFACYRGGISMTKKDTSAKKSVRKAIARRIVAVANIAKESAQAVLITDRTLPPPVEIEPRCLDTPAVRALKKERQRLVDDCAPGGFDPGSSNHDDSYGR
jgi:hypothetical protein